MSKPAAHVLRLVLVALIFWLCYLLAL